VVEPQLQPATIGDLIADAERVGVHAKPRMITDWTVKGLLGPPTRRSSGRGRGSKPGLYSGWQRQLWRTLIWQRFGPDPEDLPDLARFPIGIWVVWGTAAVMTEQVERALGTWLSGHPRGSQALARQDVAAAIESIAHPDATRLARANLARLATTVLLAGRVDHPDTLNEALLDVCDPHREGRLLGPPHSRYKPAEVVQRLINRDNAVKAIKVEAAKVKVTKVKSTKVVEMLDEVREPAQARLRAWVERAGPVKVSPTDQDEYANTLQEIANGDSQYVQLPFFLLHLIGERFFRSPGNAS
jgi:hypothetical protein